MILIGENIHIVSKQVKFALENRDENFVKNLLNIQQNMDAVDLNVGPARGKLDNIFEWLGNLAGKQNISFDSTNPESIKLGLKLYGNENSFINSTSADDEKLDILTDLAIEYDCNLIALSMSKETGIPKTAEGRMELVFKIYEKCMEKGIKSEKIFFDPLILPVKNDCSQPIVALDTIKIVKESFDPPVNTVVGLSNISNGVLKENRPLINRVFAVLAFGAGLDAAIIDAKDNELCRILKMLENNVPENETDDLYIKLSNMIKCFGELEDVEFDKASIQMCNVMKTAAILLNKTVYTDSFTQI